MFKFTFQNIALICVALTTVSTTAFAAAGGNGSGGGDVIVLPNHGDDRVLLADPWLKAESPIGSADCVTRFTPPQAVVNELGRVTRIISAYGNADETSSNSFVSDRVLDPKIHYCLVDTLPKRKACDRRMDYGNLPAGAKVIPAACTDGAYTWVVKGLLKAMPVREQARLYVHEGLRRTNTPEETIAGVTDGLDLLLNQYNEELSGHLENLSRAQSDQVLEFRKNLAIAGLTDADPRNLSISDLDAMNANVVINRGGGIVNKAAKVSPAAYIGVGVLIGYDAAIGAGSSVVDSQIDGKVTIGRDTQVLSSKINVCDSSSRVLQMGDRDLVLKSTVFLSCRPGPTPGELLNERGGMVFRYFGPHKPAVIGNKVVVRDSTVNFNYMVYQANIENGTRILDSNVTNISTGHGVVVESSSIYTDIGFEFFSELDKSTMEECRIGAGSHLNHIHINKGNGHGLGLIRLGRGVSLSHIALTNVTEEISPAFIAGGFLLGAATMGLGPIALSIGVGNGGKLIIDDGASINARGHALCSRGYHVSYGEVLTGNRVGSLGDFRGLCRQD